VVAMLEARRADVRACYEAELAVDPELRGVLALQFTIDAQGVVGDVRPQEGAELLPPWSNVASCAARVVRGLSFEEGPPEPATFALPLVFTPEG
jgi:hypothetical protein